MAETNGKPELRFDPLSALGGPPAAGGGPAEALTEGEKRLRATSMYISYYIMDIHSGGTNCTMLLVQCMFFRKVLRIHIFRPL